MPEGKIVTDYVRNLYVGDVCQKSGSEIIRSIWLSPKIGRNQVNVRYRTRVGHELTGVWNLNTKITVFRPTDLPAHLSHGA